MSKQEFLVKKDLFAFFSQVENIWPQNKQLAPP